MKKFIKISSVILLVVWSIILILGLSFGTGVASKIVKNFRNIFEETLNNFELEDVQIVGQTQYISGKKHVLEYKTIGNVKNKDYELKFKSLDTSIFVVDAAGAITGKNTTDETYTGTLLITSNIDKDFKKEITITFINVSPESFDVIVTTLNSNVNELIVGVPFYIYTKVTSTNEYNVKTPKYLLDEEYFKKITTNKYIPIKEVDSVVLKASIGTTTQEKEVKVVRKELDTKIDAIKLLPGNKEMYEVGTTIYLSLLINETKQRKANVNYNIRIENENIIKLTTLERLSAKAAGTTIIYVDVLDIDGNVLSTFEKEITIVNKDEPVSPPVAAGPNMSKVPDVIETLQEEHKTMSVEFPKNAEFKDVPNGLTISIDKSGRVLKVYSKTVGEYKVKLVASLNGITEEKTITVVVKRDSMVATYKALMKNIASFVTKIMGHLCLFMVEGIVAIWCLFNNKTKKKWVDFIIFVSIGLSIGFLTEFIQIFLEGRNPAIKDVGIDFVGYLIGGGITFILVNLIVLIIHHKNKNKKTKIKSK